MLPDDFTYSPEPAPLPGYTPLSWWETWVKALTQPKVEAYEQIANDPDASLLSASLWVFLGTLVAMFISLPISFALNPQMIEAMQEIKIGGEGGALTVALIVMLCMTPLAGVLAVLGLMFSTAVIQLVARLFGGQGSFGQLYYTFAAFTGPITPISALISVIPLVNCLGIFVSIYSLVLQVIAIKATNRFGWGAAVASLLIPGVVVLVVICCGVAAMASVLGPAMEETLRQLQFAP